MKFKCNPNNFTIYVLNIRKFHGGLEKFHGGLEKKFHGGLEE